VLRAWYNAGALPVPENFGSGSAWGSVANLGLSWNLDFWGRQRDLVREADRLGRAGAFDARAAELSLEGSIVSTYIELDRDHALADIAAEVERNRAELAELERRRVNAGLDTTVELRTAAARIPEVRVDRAQARSRIDIGVHELAELSGQGAALYARVTRPRLNEAQALPLPSSLPGDLLLRRPDVAAALARVESASAGEEAARLAAYPDIELRGLGAFAALSLSDLLERPARVFAAGPALALPIFDAGRIRAEHRAANADLELAVAQYDATVLQAVREAADQLTTLAALDVVIADQQRNLDLLTEARALAEERYQAGLTTRQLVLDAEARLLTVRSALVNSRALAAEVRVALLVAVGGSTTPLGDPTAKASL
jgi:NodT family efflux transporter outer membrane factor (OMF) lipoprotein